MPHLQCNLWRTLGTTVKTSCANLIVVLGRFDAQTTFSNQPFLIINPKNLLKFIPHPSMKVADLADVQGYQLLLYVGTAFWKFQRVHNKAGVSRKMKRFC